MAGVLWNNVYPVAAVTAPNLWDHQGALTASEGVWGNRIGVMRSQCPKYAMHAKEIGLRIMRSNHPLWTKLKGLTHRAYGRGHDDKELKKNIPEHEFFNHTMCTPRYRENRTHRN
jgi:hypothetical protein